MINSKNDYILIGKIECAKRKTGPKGTEISLTENKI